MGDVSGDRQDRVGGIVLLGHVLADAFLGNLLHRLRGPAHVPAHGLVRPQRLVDHQVHFVCGMVVGHP